jgi:phosphoribosylformimino-5-aminoimidazole carboxamide ribotide isomerase
MCSVRVSRGILYRMTGIRRKGLHPMRFRPCIDLHRGKVKQIVGNTLPDGTTEAPVTNFETDRPASFFAGLFRNDRLRGGHVIMLGPGNESAAREALRTFPGGLQIGGGITPDNTRTFLDGGASHVIVTSHVFSGGAIRRDRLALMEKTAGKKRLVLDLSCRRTGNGYSIACDRWQKDSGVLLTEKTVAELAGHCDEFLVHAIDVEGRRGGIDAGLVELLASLSPITVTYAGGIRSIDDLEKVRKLGEGRCDATVGSALDIYGGALKYGDVVAWQREQEKIS